MIEPTIIVAITVTFLVAGAVKGVIGLGLPTVSLGLLSVVLDLPTAMALLIVPSFATNLWQALAGGQAGVIIARIWPFLLFAGATVWVGAAALTRMDLNVLTGLLGVLLAGYALVGLGGIRLALPRRWEIWAGPLIGTANGILTGMTGSFVVPGVMYLQAIGLPREALIQAMGILFTLSTLALAGALGGRGLLTAELGVISALALLPAILGMIAGQRLRQTLSETVFRRVFFAGILLLGAYIIASSAGLVLGKGG